MKMLVAGAGNIGGHLALDLAGRGHEVVLTERQADTVGKLPPAERLTTVVGDACALEVLERAGAREVDVVVAATGDDEDNLVVSLLCKQEFAVPHVLARVNHPTNRWLFDEAWGVDVAVSPPDLLTALVEEEVTAGDVVGLMPLEHGRVELVEVRLDERSAAVGQRVADLGLPADLVLLAVVREGHVKLARGATPLDEGDAVLALVPVGSGDELRRHLIG
jgi:trk system potassium uptake protein TrkA